jgi:hypothetical protein
VPFPLHKFPLGLLEVFRLRTSGGQPTHFGEAVQPVSDVTDFYASDLLQVFNASSGATTLPLTLVTTLPNPRRIVGVSGVVVIGANAGTVLRLRLGVRTNASQVIHYIGNSQPTSAVNTTFPALGSALPPYTLPAGSQFVLEVDSNATGGDHVIAIRYLAQDFAVSG